MSHTRTLQLRRALPRVLLLLAVAACSDANTSTAPGTTPPAVVRIDLSNASLRLLVGTSQGLTALPRGNDGRPIGDAIVRWRSSDASVATVSDAGVVTAQRSGTTTISAECGTASASLVVTVVTAINAARVVVSPSHLTLGIGDAEFVDVDVFDEHSERVEPARPTWSSGDTSIAVVDAAGRVATRRSGIVRIFATHNAVADTLELTVTTSATAPSLAGRWRLDQVAGRSVPTVYRQFRDELVGDHVVALVEIRIDSATATVSANGGYVRRYYFTEWHDGVRMYPLRWGDNGRYALRGQGAPMTATVRFASDYIQNLWTGGQAVDGVLHLAEQLWTGETTEAARWVRAGG